MVKAAQDKTEHLIMNAKARTMDPALPRAEAVAIKNGRVAAVGSRDHCRAALGARPQVIDLAGRLLLPGFTDAHLHYFDWAQSLARIPLGRAQDRAQALAMVAERAAAAPPGQWILGRGLEESDWPEPVLPTLAELDAAAPANPVLLFRRDMHLTLTNSAALAVAGVTRDTADPKLGRIGRDEAGEPNGRLYEKATYLALGRAPEHTEDQVLELMKAGLARLHALGFTGVHDFRVTGRICGLPSFTAWQRLQEAGDLSLRVWMCVAGDRMEDLVCLGLRSGFGGEMLKLGHLKFFSDGSLGARTAWMLEPYNDAAAGGPMTPPEELAPAILRAHANGLAVAVHAIGDRANRELIRVMGQTLGNAPAGNAPAAPHRIEHLQMLGDSDLEALASLNLVGSVQPMHIVEDIGVMSLAVGERTATAYRFKELLARGVPLCFGSDAPVSEPDALGAIAAAVTRQTPEGLPEEGWRPAQRLSVEQAVFAQTMGPATASGRGRELGSISPGKFADLTALDRDIFQIPPREIWQTKAVFTMVGGRVVFRR